MINISSLLYKKIIPQIWAFDRALDFYYDNVIIFFKEECQIVSLVFFFFMFESHVLLSMILITHWTTYYYMYKHFYMCCVLYIASSHLLKSPLLKKKKKMQILTIYADGEAFFPVCSLAINLLNLSVERYSHLFVASLYTACEIWRNYITRRHASKPMSWLLIIQYKMNNKAWNRISYFSGNYFNFSIRS